MVIWKLPVKRRSRSELHMPEGATILSVAYQGDELYLWASVDPSAKLCVREIEINGTGHPLDVYSPGKSRIHLATVQHEDFVWHVFELVTKRQAPLSRPAETESTCPLSSGVPMTDAEYDKD